MPRKIAALLLALLLLIPASYAQEPRVIYGTNDTVTISRSEYEKLQKYQLLEEVRTYIEQYYYVEPDEQAMMDGAIQGLLSGLGDAYTFYYPQEAWESMWEDDEGKYAGIGVQMLGDEPRKGAHNARIIFAHPKSFGGVLIELKQKGE